MSRIIDKAASVVSSPSVIYVILRYVTYFLAFVNALLLAKYLGGYEYGIYSFVLLIVSYMAYANLGINESLNTEYSKYKNTLRANKIWDTAWSLNLLICLAVSLLWCAVTVLDSDLFANYHFRDYGYLLIVTCLVINLGRIYITYYKLFGKLLKLNIQQILPNITILVLCLVFKTDITVNMIVWALLITNSIALLLFRIGLPQRPKFTIDRAISKVLITRGISLLLYNLSFYLMILFASSLVSANFEVTEFGCFSFANSLVNGVIMAGGAFLFIFYPKILNQMEGTDQQIEANIRRIKSIYVVGIDMICLVSILCVYVISFWYPEYSIRMVQIYSVLILGKCLNNATTGYSAFLIARKKEIRLAAYGFCSVGVVWALSSVFLRLKLGVEYIALTVTVASFVYSSCVVIEGVRTLYHKISFRSYVYEIFGNGSWLNMLLLVLFAFVWPNPYFLLGSIGLYYILNFKNIKKAISSGLDIMTNKNALNF